MSSGSWKLMLTLLFLSVFLMVHNAAIIFPAISSLGTQSNNLFLSLISETNYSVSLPYSFSKSVSAKKQNPSLGKKKGTEKATLSYSAPQLPKLKTSSRKNITSRTNQIITTLSMKDILETSEGCYALIDKKSIACLLGMRVAGKSC